MPTTTEHVKERFRRFAEDECENYSPVYYELSRSVAADDGLAGFVAITPNQQPNLFFAAVQYLTGPEEMPCTGADIKAFVMARGSEVAALMASRRTQTNEVGRCAALLPALPSGPLALVEVGASAGLCLLLDQFGYDYGSARIGVSNSPVRIHCRLLGDTRPHLALPDIVWRCGLDIDPVDLRDASSARWLLACVWQDHDERRRRLEAAIDLWRKAPPTVYKGDLVEDLPRVLAEAPSNTTLVVFHSAVLPYISPQKRQRFVETISDLSKQRDIVWVSNESPRVQSHPRGFAPPARFQIGRTHLHNGIQEASVLGIAHPHGAELLWLGGGANAAGTPSHQ